jgi:hypothetical protein
VSKRSTSAAKRCWLATILRSLSAGLSIDVD